MLDLDGSVLRDIAPHVSGAAGARQAEIIARVGRMLATTLSRYRVDTRLRIAHFLAQTCHESAGFRTTEEFASGKAYEGRADLGNTQTGDGPRYKGRGLLQLTGRANYRTVGQALGIDLEADPTRAAEPELSLAIACEYWTARRINDPSDADDLIAVTKRVNGGLNGLSDRRGYLIKAKAALARRYNRTPPSVTAHRMLRRGSRGEEVGALQRALQKAGCTLAVDEEFGPDTEAAVKSFQVARGLAADGIAGPATWTALGPA